MKWPICLFALFLLTPNIAFAQDIRRCVKSDGTITYTDKSCTDGEVEKQKAPQNSTRTINKKKIYTAPNMCIKNTNDLLYSVRIAIDTRDANQLARNYHWANLSNQQANSVFNRLESIVAKPLIDIRLLQATNTKSSNQALESNPNMDAESAIKSPSTSYAIKIVQQNKSADDQQLSTVFKLQQNYGCYWLKF